jgi:type I restriction enzyme S subunit
MNKGKALTPKLRFPEFRDAAGWDVAGLGELTEFVNERIPIERLKLADYVSTENILPDYSGVTKASKLPSTGSATRFRPNDTLVSNIRPYLKKVWFSDKDGGASNDVIVIRAKHELLTQYFPFLLRNDSFIDYVMKGAKGVKMPRGDIDSMKAYPAFYPTKPEQQKIAECLSSVDELIAAQARKLDALKTHKKGLMQQLFPREGETQPRLRFPEFQNAGEWEICELGSVSDVRDGTHDSPEFFPSGRPLVTSKNLGTDGALDLENVSLISEQDYDQINKRSKVRVGDILFGMIGTIGNPVLVKSEGFAIKNVALIKPLERLMNSFVVQLLQSEYVAAIFAVLNTGNSQKFIALGKIRSLPVPVPTLPEQQRIADCLTSLDDLIAAQSQKLDALKTHKKGLMQQLFPSAQAVEA